MRYLVVFEGINDIGMLTRDGAMARWRDAQCAMRGAVRGARCAVRCAV